MWSGIRSVGRSTRSSGKRPSSDTEEAYARLGSTDGDRTAAGATRARVSRRDRAACAGPHRRRRPLPGDRGEPSLQRVVPARPAPPRQRGARRATTRRHHPRAANQDERKRMTQLRERIKDVIEKEPVALFMKGTPQFVMCGNSDRALRALREAGAPVTTVDILPDPAIRHELLAVSGWPTIPQVFVKGELIGGADIVEELAASGELVERRSQRMDVVEHATRDDRIEGARIVKLFQRDLPVQRPFGRVWIDRQDVVAHHRKPWGDSSLVATADLEDPTWRLGQLRECESREVHDSEPCTGTANCRSRTGARRRRERDSRHRTTHRLPAARSDFDGRAATAPRTVEPTRPIRPCRARPVALGRAAALRMGGFHLADRGFAIGPGTHEAPKGQLLVGTERDRVPEDERELPPLRLA